MALIKYNYNASESEEIYNSLVESFKDQYGSERKDIAKGAKEMKEQLSGFKDAASKSYITVLNKIIADYTKKQTIEELEKAYNDKKFAKIKKKR